MNNAESMRLPFLSVKLAEQLPPLSDKVFSLSMLGHLASRETCAFLVTCKLLSLSALKSQMRESRQYLAEIPFQKSVSCPTGISGFGASGLAGMSVFMGRITCGAGGALTSCCVLI